MSETLAEEVLRAAVEKIGGTHREGQLQMAKAIDTAIDTGTHLLVQAGTGTGKSLGYLSSILLQDEKVVVATATLALQNQLVTSDVPVALDAVEKVTGRRPTVAVFKGRSNYLCLYRVRDDLTNPQGELFSGSELVDLTDRVDEPVTALGAEVLMLRDWATEQLEDKAFGDRDDAPPHSQRAWAQVSTSGRECLGMAKCPFGAECFAEAANEKARSADLIITNHALVALDAIGDKRIIPSHKVLVIDEAHDLVNRVTGAASAELSPQAIGRVAGLAKSWLSDELIIELTDAGETFKKALANSQAAHRISESDIEILASLRDLLRLLRQVISSLSGSEKTEDLAKTQALAVVQAVFETCDRICGLSEDDVAYVSESEKYGRQLVVAPLAVDRLVREQVLSEATTIFTSATLKVGGEFTSLAKSVGLYLQDKVEESVEDSDPPPVEGANLWQGIDVGSPFDYGKQGILYIGSRLARPGRDGIGEDALAQLVELIRAAGGRTLALFAARKSAELATEYARTELPEYTFFCQGEGNLPHLTRQFREDDTSCLFGTMSLWQGVDAPGDICRLVVIDKIPFPRPDDPLLRARQDAVEKAGGNGFMQVAATHAGLLLAQGAGRLIRSDTDRGVVAVLDPRLETARYGSFLSRSLPSFWKTTDLDVVLGALERLDGS